MKYTYVYVATEYHDDGEKFVEGVYDDLKSAIWAITLGDYSDFNILCGGTLLMNKKTNVTYNIQARALQHYNSK